MPIDPTVTPPSNNELRANSFAELMTAIEWYATVRAQHASWSSRGVTPDPESIERYNLSAAKANLQVILATEGDAIRSRAGSHMFSRIGEGGEFALIATASGAGLKKGSDNVAVFRDTGASGDFYYSAYDDFSRSMAPISPTPALVITIMPEHGMSAYAWVKDASDTDPWVGMSVGGYLEQPEKFPITEELHDQFVAWSSEYEVDSGKHDFDWEEFHAKGMRLTRALKTQVGCRFRVLYRSPNADHSVGREIF